MNIITQTKTSHNITLIMIVYSTIIVFTIYFRFVKPGDVIAQFDQICEVIFIRLNSFPFDILKLVLITTTTWGQSYKTFRRLSRRLTLLT